MLLQKLDVPVACPHTLAFAVDRKRVSKLRAALKELIEQAQVAPLRAFCEARSPELIQQLSTARVAVDAKEINRLYELANLDAPTMTDVFTVPADRWLAISQSHVALEENEDWALRLLHELRDDVKPVDAIELPALKNVWWARGLTFRGTDGVIRREVQSATDDVVIGVPEEFDMGEMSPFDVLEMMRAHLTTPLLLEMLTEPFSPSFGPGPFLPVPPHATPLQDPRWQPLPIFAVKHWNWPLLEGFVLEDDDLREVEKMVRTAEPQREWHESYNSQPIDDATWKQLVEDHWPRLSERFAVALGQAHRDEKSVLILNNDLSHPFWCGPAWPPRVRNG